MFGMTDSTLVKRRFEVDVDYCEPVHPCSGHVQAMEHDWGSVVGPAEICQEELVD